MAFSKSGQAPASYLNGRTPALKGIFAEKGRLFP